MLSKEDLSRVAEVKNLSLKNTEQDYLLELLLYLIYSYTGKELAFKGGTALYKVYGLNRFSEDLDFTLIEHRLKIDEMLVKIVRGLGLLGISATIHERKSYRNEINIKLAVRGPLYDGRKESLTMAAINISTRERVAKPLLRENIITPYREIPTFEVYAMDLQEIMAEKVRAIITRQKARDAYDLWFLTKKGAAFDESLVNKKLRIHEMKFERERFIQKLEEKKGMWQTDLRGIIIGTLPEFGIVKSGIVRWMAHSA